MSEIPHIDWQQIAQDAGGFSPQVFEFIRDGLEHTARMVHGSSQPRGHSDGLDDQSGDEPSRHVSGVQLCLGLRDLAVERYGSLARTVLEHWNVRSTEDFGRLVFALIDAGILRESAEDRYEDFVGVYDFDEAFAEGELI